MTQTALNSVLMTPQEVAAYLNLKPKYGPQTVVRWVKKGELRAARLGRSYRFRRSDVDAYIFSKR